MYTSHKAGRELNKKLQGLPWNIEEVVQIFVLLYQFPRIAKLMKIFSKELNSKE